VHPSSRALESAIADALADARLGPADVNAVVSGIAGVSPFDEAEAVAIRRALGDTVPIKRPKHLFGETFGAGGALGMLAAMGLLLDAAPAAPTRAPVRTPVRTVLVTALGYYGNASALVMRAATG
jgi:3-oxoacyl-(acyl-carrier-protein) synthase